MSQNDDTIPTECPFADAEAIVARTKDGLSTVVHPEKRASSCPFHAHTVPASYRLAHAHTPITVSGGTHQTSSAQAKLLHDIGGGDRIREYCTRFYARAFEDYTLAPFFFLEDGATAHGKRLADWIIQKIGGEGEPWTESGRWGMRQHSHHAAWNSRKRHPSVRGEHFQLDDARVWMRLHFWAMRECGLNEHQNFWDWYTQFIEHFMTVYERRAPRYAVEDSEWSANQQNIDMYFANGHKMVDVIGIGRH